MNILWKTVTIDSDDYVATWEQHRITGAIRNERTTHKTHAIQDAQRMANQYGHPVGYQLDGQLHWAEPTRKPMHDRMAHNAVAYEYPPYRP